MGVGIIALTAACAAPEPLPVLPEGVATKDFTFADESYLRGVRGSNTTSPRGRPAAIFDVVYKLQCIADGAPQNYNQAKQILDKAFVVVPFYYQNSRERGQWNTSARRLMGGTGCVLDNFSYEAKTTDPALTNIWALVNKVPPAR